MTAPMTIGSLFAGVGGLELGLERATGATTAWQVEIDPFCRSILEKHWPAAQRFTDVREVGAHNAAPVDILCGGFPCQDISYAGEGVGLAGERSGLWFEYARIIRELRPRFVVVENVAALLARGLGTVLGDLAACGYDAAWDCVPAAAVGAPHRRDRLFIVAWRLGDAASGGLRLRDASREGRQPAFAGEALADANGERGHRARLCGDAAGRSESANGRGADVADTDGIESERIGVGGVVSRTSRTAEGEAHERQRHGDATRDGREALADADGAGPQGHGRPVGTERAAGPSAGPRAAHGAGAGPDESRAAESRLGRNADGLPARLDGAFATGIRRVRAAGYRWPARPGEAQHPWEPPRTARGVPDRAARLKAIGNAVSPQVGEAIGHVVAAIAGGAR